MWNRNACPWRACGAIGGGTGSRGFVWQSIETTDSGDSGDVWQMPVPLPPPPPLPVPLPDVVCRSTVTAKDPLADPAHAPVVSAMASATAPAWHPRRHGAHAHPTAFATCIPESPSRNGRGSVRDGQDAGAGAGAGAEGARAALAGNHRARDRVGLARAVTRAGGRGGGGGVVQAPPRARDRVEGHRVRWGVGAATRVRAAGGH